MLCKSQVQPHLAFELATIFSGATTGHCSVVVLLSILMCFFQLMPSPDVRCEDVTSYGTATETVVIQGVMGDVNPIVASFRKPVPVPANVCYVAGMKFLVSLSISWSNNFFTLLIHP